MLRFTSILFIALLYSCSLSLRAPSSVNSQIDIIFDLDWTLVKQVDAVVGDDSNYIHVGDEIYRLGDGAVELLDFLFSKQGIRVSFFSGGKFSRNSELLKKIKTRHGNAFDLAYRVLSYEDLTKVSSDEGLSFSKRFKKDIRLVTQDVSNTLLIDDDQRFLLSESYRKNLLWMGETYKHFESFTDITNFSDQYVPLSQEQWQYDRRKLYFIKDILEKSLEKRENFLWAVRFEREKYNFEYNLSRKEMSCHTSMNAFLSVL
ncbi:hypothetical protein [Halobacteriovorax marinus]|nr:hypothetical protein [Halobacteriovorax marinus]